MGKVISILIILLQISTYAEKKTNNEEASYLFNAKFYEKALNKIDKKEYKFLTALSYFRIKNYEEALKYFKLIDLNKVPFIKNEVAYYKAHSLFSLNKAKESLAELKKIDNNFILQKQKDILFLKIVSSENFVVDTETKTNLDEVLKKYKDLKINLSSDMDLSVLIAKMELILAKIPKVTKLTKYNPLKLKKTEAQVKAIKKFKNIIASVLVKNPNKTTKDDIYKILKEYKLKVKLDLSQKVEKCSHLIKLHQNESGNKCFEKFIDTIPQKNNKTFCNAQYFNSSALKKRRKHTLAVKGFRKLIKTCKNYKRLDKANYLAGLSSLMKKSHKDAISFFKTLYTKYPKSYLADDGINYIGFIYSKQKKYKLAEKIYSSQIKNFPKGDTTEEAVWKIAYNLYKQKKYNKYIKFHKKVFSESFIETKYYSRGRLDYWLAKTHEKLKNKEKAQELYKNIILNNNNNFYAFMARMKYEGTLPKKEWAQVKKEGAKKFIKYLKENNKFEKVQWIIKNKLNEFLIYELNALNKKDKIFDKYKKEIAIFLIDAKIYHLPFWHTKINQKWVPYNIDLDKNIDYFKKLYPKAYYVYVEKYSKKAKISPFLALSIMREESYFHSSIESWANAYGLMQIIEPTAKDLARNLKVKYKREFLFNPDFNIKLGTTYLGWSTKKFKNKKYFVIPSYNAGLGAVRRWKKLKFNKKKKDYDMFIEDIPYTETRHYTKRVLTTFFIYNKLYRNLFIKL